MIAWRDVLSGVRTLASAAVYTTLIVTFGFRVARVDGLSMAPTLQDQDRLIVNRPGVRAGCSAARRHRHAVLPAESRDAVHPEIAATSAREYFTGTRGLYM